MSFKHSASEDSTPTQRRSIWMVLIAAIVIIALTASLFELKNRGGDSTGSSTSATVDTSGQQQQDAEPAPGQSIGDMTLRIGKDDAPVEPVQVTDQGALIPPKDVHRLGWYSASAVPGQDGNGSSVITGHVNFEGQGEGYAKKFTTLHKGEKITTKIDGKEQSFQVSQEPIQVAKGGEMPAVVNENQGSNKLVLITCGGKFVGGQLGYADDIITVADPIR